jgi:hypothetical protein
MKKETQGNKDKYSRKVFTKQISTSAQNRIALQYATLKQDASRYREEMQTKFTYPAEDDR